MTDERTPWLEALSPWPEALGWAAGPPADLSTLDRYATLRACVSGAGRPLRFVAADPAALPGAGYEQQIFDHGTVATRLEGRGALHDFANALSWIAFPRLKARLNALHVEALAQPVEPGRRGALRDRATLLDESGALVLTDDPGVAALLRGFCWRELFVLRRADWPSRIRVLPLGHALLEKLRAPYKSLCAHAWVLAVKPSTALDEIDTLAARALNHEALAALTPLPLMGIPGWSSSNDDPAFYNDPKVFRSGKTR